MSRFSPPVPLFVWGSATRINLINLIEKSGKTPWFPRAPGAPGGPRGPPFSKKKFEIYFFYIFFISLISLIWRHDTPHGTRQRRVKKQHTDSFSIRFIRRDAGNGMFSGAGTSRSQLPHRSCAAQLLQLAAAVLLAHRHVLQMPLYPRAQLPLRRLLGQVTCGSVQPPPALQAAESRRGCGTRGEPPPSTGNGTAPIRACGPSGS